MFDIQEELRKLPQKAGVYIMKDEAEAIVYVGKAVNLRSRVRQYFQGSAAAVSPKVGRLAKVVKSFEYIVTDNEVEALVLECNLIKKHYPKYNVLLKDDKTYPYLKMSMGEDFPRLFSTRRLVKDRGKYFGPFVSGGALKELIAFVHQLWPLRRCLKKIKSGRFEVRPCLNHHIGQCMAPCCGLISQEDYRKMVDDILLFLQGKHSEILKKMEERMAAFVEEMEFEKAAVVRDQISAVKSMHEEQKMQSGLADDMDVIAFARAFDEALVQVFFIRAGKIIGREHFMLNGVENLSRPEITTEFIKRFYSEAAFIPKEIIAETDIIDKETISSWLSGLKEQNVTITRPQKGEKKKLVDLAAKNAVLSLEQSGEQLKREHRRTVGALEEIGKALGLTQNLTRIEAFDISNIHGFESVGSLVVFENGKPKRSDYRKFRIKSVTGANDYASMEEVITRRFSKYSKLPDIIMVDGGRGQVSSAQKVLAQMSLDIPVCGMVKDNRHRTRGLVFCDEEVTMPYTSEGFKLVTRIQDEVHRFALEYHRKLREKRQIHSVLDDIKGIGDTRRKALFRHFGDIDRVRNASLEELLCVPTMNKRAAQAVFDFFNEISKNS